LSHRDTSIDLNPLTVLVGENGGGKSALFDALINFSMISKGSIDQAFGPYPYSYKSTLHRSAGTIARIAFEAHLSESENSTDFIKYEIAYSQNNTTGEDISFVIHTEKLTSMPNGEVIFDRSNSDDYHMAKDVNIQNNRSIFSLYRRGDLCDGNSTFNYITKHIGRISKFKLDYSTLASPNRIPDISAPEQIHSMPRIGYHGEDLAATLYYLSETDNSSYNTITALIKDLVPEFDGFSFSTIGTDRIGFSVVYGDARGTVPSVRLSSGFITYIGLIALVSTPNRPPFIMIEEPENGLTPAAIKLLYNAVKNLAIGDSDVKKSQIVLSSHSPFIITEAWNGDSSPLIQRIKIANGKSEVVNFVDAVSDAGIQLSKDSTGTRNKLSVGNAAEIMSGYLS
jgi:predicted ATPase